VGGERGNVRKSKSMQDQVSAKKMAEGQLDPTDVGEERADLAKSLSWSLRGRGKKKMGFS